MIDPLIDPSKRLRFEPVMASHAQSMFPLLSDPNLYQHTGGEPPGSLADVERWFSALESRKSPDEKEHWLTWILIAQDSGAAIGYVQATIANGRADMAWLVGTAWQGLGYASEAAVALACWLQREKVNSLRALIHPDNMASQKVAIAVGLKSSGDSHAGEEIWCNRLCAVAG